ncbi:hypothetical protein M434DRAFT_392125 [Hypoxylon sp. CO27-5]|nr:hypothetical protein M434DRAFT_392125 [Hypoxylon sp. CO27-5]
MTEGPQAPEDAAAARAAEQARLRKERREAKIKAGGAARLNKITGLGGGIQRDPVPQPSSETTGTPQTTNGSSVPETIPTAASDQHGDPEEVDISEHHYEPRTTARQQPANNTPDDLSEAQQAQLRQLLLGGGAGPQPGRNPFLDSPGSTPPMPGMEGMEGMEEDPMMKMLSQMMSGGGMPSGPGGANPFAGTPMEGLLGGLGNLNGAGAGPGAPNPMQQAQQLATNKSANLWRILHAIFALGLGLYVAFSTTFTGTLTEREHSSIASKTGAGEEDSIDKTRAYFFYVFTSVEAVLLTTRYFLDKGREPQILSTVRSDALVCVFVLGVCSWLRS